MTDHIKDAARYMPTEALKRLVKHSEELLEMKPNFIQWKGTDLCMDLYCPECGTHSHLDGFFAYYVRCPSCKTVFRLSDHVAMTKVEPGAALYPDIEPIEGEA